MQLRLAISVDRDAIRAIYLDAFPENERTEVAKLALQLLDEGPATISLVAEVDGEIVAHCAFSPAGIVGNEAVRAYILAPLAVSPACQRQCIGTTLVESGISELGSAGADILFVYGDPKYYGRFGFETEPAENYLPPHALEYPFGWQAQLLNEDLAVSLPAQLTCVAPLDDPGLW